MLAHIKIWKCGGCHGLDDLSLAPPTSVWQMVMIVIEQAAMNWHNGDDDDDDAMTNMMRILMTITITTIILKVRRPPWAGWALTAEGWQCLRPTRLKPFSSSSFLPFLVPAPNQVETLFLFLVFGPDSFTFFGPEGCLCPTWLKPFSSSCFLDQIFLPFFGAFAQPGWNPFHLLCLRYKLIS